VQNLSILKDSHLSTTSGFQTRPSLRPLSSKNIMSYFSKRKKKHKKTLTQTITKWLHIKGQDGYIQSAAKAECK